MGNLNAYKYCQLSRPTLEHIERYERFAFQMGVTESKPTRKRWSVAYPDRGSRRDNYPALVSSNCFNFTAGSHVSIAAFGVPNRSGSSAVCDEPWDRFRRLPAQRVDRLDQNEEFVIVDGYANGVYLKVHIFRCLAAILGVYEKGLRQLDPRAAPNLQVIAVGQLLDALIGPEFG